MRRCMAGGRSVSPAKPTLGPFGVSSSSSFSPVSLLAVLVVLAAAQPCHTTTTPPPPPPPSHPLLRLTPAHARLQSTSLHSVDNATHWGRVDAALGAFDHKVMQPAAARAAKGAPDHGDELAAFLEIEADYAREREVFLDTLRATELGRYVLELADRASEIDPQRLRESLFAHQLEQLHQHQHQHPHPLLSFLETGSSTHASLLQQSTVMESNPTTWPCSFGKEACKCEEVCETCEFSPIVEEDEEGGEEGGASTHAQVLVQRGQHGNDPWTARDHDHGQGQDHGARDVYDGVVADAQADADAFVQTRQRVVRRQSVGHAATPEAAAMLQMQLTEDGKEAASCNSCENQCSCVSDAECTLPTPDKTHCKMAHARLLQCELICLPIWPFNMICEAFTNCLNKCKVDGPEGFPEGLKELCKAFCGCRKFCIEG